MGLDEAATKRKLIEEYHANVRAMKKRKLDERARIAKRTAAASSIQRAFRKYKKRKARKARMYGSPDHKGATMNQYIHGRGRRLRF